VAERNWNKKGALPKGALPRIVAVDAGGVGIVSAYTEPSGGDPAAQLRGRRAQLVRVTGAGTETAYEGPGWILAVDGVGAIWFAVIATLRSSGEGSDYRLLRSTDGGKRWTLQGALPAPSVAQVLAVNERQAWVLGAGTLSATNDGGQTWSAVHAPGSRNPTLERLRRAGNAVALLGRGEVLRSPNAGAGWFPLAVSGAQAEDFDGTHLAVTTSEGRAGIGRVENDRITWLTGLPEGRRPMRIASSGSTVRVLTRAEDPSQGADLALYRSEDGGQSWSAVSLEGLRAEADIAGEYGLGVSLRGDLHGNL